FDVNVLGFDSMSYGYGYPPYRNYRKVNCDDADSLKYVNSEQW
ncbi:32926_t:CDS:1, partial [Racocetra persica]